MTVLRSRLDTTTAGAMDASHNTYVDIGESGKGSHEKGGGNLHLEKQSLEFVAAYFIILKKSEYSLIIKTALPS